jgi:putative FmdB family regulatory protein
VILEANRRRKILVSVDCVAFGGYLECGEARVVISSLGFAMPIYEYKCNKCGVFEAMQGIKEPPLKKCPTCKSKVERQMSRGSFILKGSGWYATDYAKKSTPSTDSDSTSTTEKPATNGTTASTDSSSKPASDSKPAAESKSSSSEPKPSKSKSSSEKSLSAKAAD